ncbi:MAG: asparagine synthase-related protein [Acidimicrobiales bacterium]
MTSAVDLVLTPLEIATGAPLGADPTAPSLPTPLPGGPVAALARPILEALLRPPCVVSFSGGRDSSGILALATAIAHREGLQLPVPVTLRFPASPDTDEDAWQERVIDHLGLTEWVRIELSAELDLIGPVAAAVLQRHGLLWPPNTHFHQPILDVARGGAILTGIDGDGVFASWRYQRVASVLSGRLRPTLRDAQRVLTVLSPRSARRAVQRRRPPTRLPWLLPTTMAAAVDAWSDYGATEPARWDRRVEWYSKMRSLRLVLRGFDLLADDADVRALHPLADPGFLAALAEAGGWSGFAGRTEIMRYLFADVLPEDVLSRESKARMNGPFWNEHSRAFIAGWDGEGGNELIDASALRAEWSKPVPHACTSTLLQAAWLARRGQPAGA